MNLNPYDIRLSRTLDFKKKIKGILAKRQGNFYYLELRGDEIIKNYRYETLVDTLGYFILRIAQETFRNPDYEDVIIFIDNLHFPELKLVGQRGVLQLKTAKNLAYQSNWLRNLQQ